MIWSTRTIAALAMGWFVMAEVCAVTSDSDIADRNYRVIIDRNPFGLKPPPPPPTNAPPPVTAKDEILLTGITSLGRTRAYFMTKPPQGKNAEYYCLGVDEKKDALEILEIDSSSKSVRVRNAGVETVMTFAANGVKPPATMAAAPGTPGAPPPPGAPPGGGMANAGNIGGAVAPPGNPALAGVNNRLRSVPSRNVRTPPPNMMPEMAAPNGAPARPSPYAAEQDVLLMELQRKANPNVVFPPTPMPQ